MENSIHYRTKRLSEAAAVAYRMIVPHDIAAVRLSE